MNRTILTAVVFLIGINVSLLHADSDPVVDTNRLAVSFMVNDFTWEEKLPDGTTLEENGPLFGLHLQVHVPMTPKWESFVYGELYAGTVDYDGFLVSIDGSVEPYKSETTYGGFSGAWDMGYHLMDGSAFDIVPFAGLGGHYWLRSLDDDEGYGYDEYWWTLYGRAGLRVAWYTQQGTELFANAALLLPFYNYERADGIPLAVGDDEVELEPKEEVGYQVDAGFSHGILLVTIFYEAMSFGESDLDDTGQFFQPESTRDVAGLRVGLNF